MPSQPLKPSKEEEMNPVFLNWPCPKITIGGSTMLGNVHYYMLITVISGVHIKGTSTVIQIRLL